MHTATHTTHDVGAPQLPVIAGVEITTDAEGRFNLNALHRASGTPKAKAPNEWLRTQQAKELIGELESQTGDSRFGPINTIRGGNAPGTFAHELLAVSYAGWISPAFQLKVNRVFIDYRTGKLAPPPDPAKLTRLEILRLAMEAEQEKQALRLQVDEMTPKAAFHDRVAIAEDAISIGEAAKIIGTGRNRLLAFMREKKWITRRNEPYQAKIEAGLMAVKLGQFQHPEHGLKSSVTPLLTGKGLIEIKKLYEAEHYVRRH